MKSNHPYWLYIVALVILGIPILGFVSKNAMMRMSGAGETMIAPAEPAVSKMAAGPITTGTTLPLEPFFYHEGFTPNVDRLIVKNAHLNLIVDDTREAINAISAITTQAQGAVTNSSVYEDEMQQGQVFASMTLRVPVEKIDAVLASIRQVATKVINENVSSLDQTEQKIDLDAQLANLQATETQLQSIMRQATTVEETLKVQVELSSVRGQIERLQAQVDNLTGEAAMSTITVSLSTEEAELPIVNENERSFWQEIRLAFREAVGLYRNLFIAGLRLLIIGLPVIIIGSLGYWLWRKKKK